MCARGGACPAGIDSESSRPAGARPAGEAGAPSSGVCALLPPSLGKASGRRGRFLRLCWESRQWARAVDRDSGLRQGDGANGPTQRTAARDRASPGGCVLLHPPSFGNAVHRRSGLRQRAATRDRASPCVMKETELEKLSFIAHDCDNGLRQGTGRLVEGVLRRSPGRTGAVEATAPRATAARRRLARGRVRTGGQRRLRRQWTGGRLTESRPGVQRSWSRTPRALTQGSFPGGRAET